MHILLHVIDKFGLINQFLFSPFLTDVTLALVPPDLTIFDVFMPQVPREDALGHVADHRVLVQDVPGDLSYTLEHQGYLASTLRLEMLQGI